ncbi:hypothetical protein [Sphingobacterium pedocola]|nr:hypothetical protein [Sphingobacterium pedocola]
MKHTKNHTTMLLRGLQYLPIGIGLLLAVEMTRIWPDLPYYYGADAVIDAAIAAHWRTGVGWSLSEVLFHFPQLSVQLIALLYITLCLLLCWPPTVRASAFVLLFIHQAFFLSETSWSYGVDYLAQTGLFISVLFYPGSDKTAAHHRWSLMGIRLLQCQLVVVYFFGGLGKLFGESWWNGSGIWKAIHQPFSGELLSAPIFTGSWPYLWMVAGLLTILIELMHPIAWLGKRYRQVILYTTIALHLGIGLFIGLYHFAALMIWYNLCAWYYPYKHTTTTYKRTPLEDNPDSVTSTT